MVCWGLQWKISIKGPSSMRSYPCVVMEPTINFVMLKAKTALHGLAACKWPEPGERIPSSHTLAEVCPNANIPGKLLMRDHDRSAIRSAQGVSSQASGTT
jgi:hypothetical protein